MASGMKAGIKSTEFWMTIVSTLLTAMGAFEGVLSPTIAATVIAVLTCAYSIMRTWAKK